MSTVKRKKKKTLLYGRSPLKYVLYGIYFLIISTFIGYHLYYSDKIIPNVSINGRDFGGLTAQDAIAKVRAEFPEGASIKVIIDGKYEKEIHFEDISFRYLPVETTSQAFSIGREKNIIDSFGSKFTALTKGVSIEPAYDYDKSKFEMLVNDMKRESGVIAEETHFEIIADELTIVAGTTGQTFDSVSVENKVLTSFATEKFAPIDEPLYEVKPQFTVSDLAFVLDELNEYLNIGFTLQYDRREWELSKEEVTAMFKVVRSPTGSIGLELNDMEVAKKLASIATEINRNPRGQVLEVEGGKAVKFVSSEEGLHLKIKESSDEVKKNILAKTADIPLQVQVASAPESENEFGIEELIGLGTSKFKGSIPGRVFNIGLASSRISGTLVPPGEEFSFVETVGEISRATGYTSAYVISGGRTILGDGGGVCQVSTTVFRAALDAGLPITERNPHSYRVGYYEQDSPPGIDAAIYSPSVDLRFMNDTPGYILITSEFNENDSTLAFKIYGQSDGRVVEIAEPKVLSRTPPPATVYEDDPSLPKGQTRQVEGAVWGASVTFGRTVTRDGEVLSNDTFKSNYRAWAAVYKVGTAE